MAEHISQEKLETFLKGKLTGEESVEILLHMESCHECQSRLPKENPQEVINRLLADEGFTKEAFQKESNLKHFRKGRASKKNWMVKIKEIVLGKKNHPDDL